MLNVTVDSDARDYNIAASCDMMPLYSDRSMNISVFLGNLTLPPGYVMSQNYAKPFWVIPQFCIITLKSIRHPGKSH
jgi:hypothetical protein